MLTKPTIENLDISSPEFIANPYPTYNMLRELDTPCWLPFYDNDENSNNESGMWLFARYDDVNAILQEARYTSVNVKAHLSNAVRTPFEQSMLQSDPPDHTRLRKLLSKYFLLKNLKQLESRIEEIVDDCLRSVSKQGGMDFMQDFAQQVPVILTAELMGIPMDDVPQLREWSVQIADGTDYISSDQNQIQQQAYALDEMHTYFCGWLQESHHQPKNTISYDLLQIYKSTDLLNKAELLSMLVLLFMASHENVSNALGNGLLTLLQHPEQKKQLIHNPQLIDSAVEEMLRYESPLQRPIIRIVTDEIVIGGHTFPPGENLSVLLGSANRDPAQFKHPDRFDITRKPNRHLAFGAGIHACIGAALTRMQLRIAFTRLLESRPDIRLASDAVQWRPLTLLRALQSLPVLY